MKTLIALVISYYRGQEIFWLWMFGTDIAAPHSAVDIINKLVIALQDRNGTSTIIYAYMGEGTARRDQYTFSPISVYALALKVHATRKC